MDIVWTDPYYNCQHAVVGGIQCTVVEYSNFVEATVFNGRPGSFWTTATERIFTNGKHADPMKSAKRWAVRMAQLSSGNRS